jgi:hypothetical protein
MVIHIRGEICGPTEQLNLTVTFKGQDGKPIDVDSYPTISIIQPSGLVALAPSSAGVAKIDTGTYSYVFTAPINGPLGVWSDVWVGYINGYRIETAFEFIVNNTQMPEINSDGHVHLGDDPGFAYSECAIININKLIKSVKDRLNSAGKAKSSDAYGNVTYLDCDILSVDMITTFLATSLWEFNQVPYFTQFTFEQDAFIDQFGQIIVEGAVLLALASIALIEKGREFDLTDNGFSFKMPQVGEMLNTQYGALLTAHFDKLKYIKNSLRPGPLSLGVFGMGSGAINPAIRRMQHMRARRIV